MFCLVRIFYLISYNFMELEANVWIAANIIWPTDNHMFTAEIKINLHKTLNVASHRGECWAR